MTWPGVMALANGALTVSYLGISIAIARGLWRSRQWRRNPLGLATAAIFFTCAVGHGLHVLGLPSHDQAGGSGAGSDHQPASAGGGAVFGGNSYFYRAIWDGLTAAVGVWYWTLRGRFPALVRGAAVFEDLLLRHNAEQTLRESEERFRGIVETTTEGVVLVDAHGCISYVNAQFAAMVGRRDEELLDQPLASLAQSEDDRERIRQGLSQVREGGTRRFEVILSDVGARPSVCAQLALSPRVDPEVGDVDGALAMVADVTEQKNVEQQLRQAQRLDAVGQLAGGVAHDFNNLLTVIDGYAAMLLTDPGLDAAGKRDVSAIRDAAARANGLTRQLLAFSRTQAAQPQAVDVNDLVRGVEEMLHRVIREDVDLVVAADAQPATVWADHGQLEQVLVNLAVNGRDAMPDGGRLTVRTEYVELAAAAQLGIDDAAYGAAAYGAAYEDDTSGGMVVLTVTDTGVGMPADVTARVFEPFFTTKEPGKGNGLGLSTAYGIIRHAGGQIIVDSAPGVGSTFRVYLPAAPKAAAEPTHDLQPHCPAVSGTENVLLVEDDVAVRTLAERILREAGYQVLTAIDGRQAVEIAVANPAFDVLVTDVVMPGMNGQQLADELRSQVPELPVVFMSAYTRGALTAGAAEPGTSYLDKPFTAATLTEAIRNVLATRAVAPAALSYPAALS